MASLVRRPDSSLYQIQFYCGGKIRRVSTGTPTLQIAKEKLRQFESAQARGEESPLPTRTPIAAIVAEYVKYMKATKTAKSAQTDTYYLREIFGKICPELETRRVPIAAGKKRPPKPGGDRRPGTGGTGILLRGNQGGRHLDVHWHARRGTQLGA